MDIHEFTSNFQGGGARQTLFRINLNNPVNSSGDGKLSISAKATQLPAWTIGEIDTPYMGRHIYFQGHRTFDPWTFTVINDEDYLVRNALEEWSHTINTVQGNIRANGSPNDSDLKAQGQIFQYSKTGSIIRVYSMLGAWPQSIGTTSLDWSSDAIQEFEVTMRFDYFGVSGGTTNNAGGIV
jgi:hypothetical protein